MSFCSEREHYARLALPLKDMVQPEFSPCPDKCYTVFFGTSKLGLHYIFKSTLWDMLEDVFAFLSSGKFCVRLASERSQQLQTQ